MFKGFFLERISQPKNLDTGKENYQKQNKKESQ